MRLTPASNLQSSICNLTSNADFFLRHQRRRLGLGGGPVAEGGGAEEEPVGELAGPPPTSRSMAALLKMLSPREQTFVTLSRAVEPVARLLPLPAETLGEVQQARLPRE